MHSTLPLSDNKLQQTVRRTRRPEVYRPAGIFSIRSPILRRAPVTFRVGMLRTAKWADGGRKTSPAPPPAANRPVDPSTPLPLLSRCPATSFLAFRPLNSYLFRFHHSAELL